MSIMNRLMHARNDLDAVAAELDRMPDGSEKDRVISMLYMTQEEMKRLLSKHPKPTISSDTKPFFGYASGSKQIGRAHV